MPEFLGWREFRRWLSERWEVGPPSWPNPNVALVGQAGSGKTTFTREILPMRDRVCVFGTKVQDSSLYDPLLARGYKLKARWSPRDVDDPRVIFRPPLSQPTREALERQADAFRSAILELFAVGGWTIVLDEVRYLSQTLRLSDELDLLWLQGRSLGVVIVAGTQRPVSVPINMFEQSRFLVSWRISGMEDRRVMASYAGTLRPLIVEASPLLPLHECLVADVTTSEIVRTHVDPRRA